MNPTAKPTDSIDRDRRYYRLAMRIFVEFGAEIAVPVVLFTWLGKTLDARWGTKPWLIIAGFILAATLSVVAITKRAKHYGKEYDDIGKK
ncbi:MAG: AtpZ/AtpI family protein [Patescibacteria group bacterium]|nr:AtpZ/AtpI family protein [Patescibacteria group bacterium]